MARLGVSGEPIGGARPPVSFRIPGGENSLFRESLEGKVMCPKGDSTEQWLPSFIGGFRSGSTLLINLLGMHPLVAPWFETKGLCEPLRWLRISNQPWAAPLESRLARPRTGAEFDLASIAVAMQADCRETASRLVGTAPSGKASYEHYPIGFDCVGYSAREAESATERWLVAARTEPTILGVSRATGSLIRGLGERHAHVLRRRHWINKTPEIVRFGRELEQCIGPCRRVLLIRNGYDVVASARHLRWASVREVAMWWKLLVEQSREGSVPGRYLELRFEDLLSNPGSQVQQLLKFLQLDGQGQPLVEEYLLRARQDVLCRTVTRREWALSGEERETVEAEAGDLLRQLDYA